MLYFFTYLPGSSSEAQEFLQRHADNGSQVIIRMRGLPYTCRADEVVGSFKEQINKYIHKTYGQTRKFNLAGTSRIKLIADFYINWLYLQRFCSNLKLKIAQKASWYLRDWKHSILIVSIIRPNYQAIAEKPKGINGLAVQWRFRSAEFTITITKW